MSQPITMKKRNPVVRIIFVFLLLIACNPGAKKDDVSVLIFSKTEGYRHTSIEAGTTAISDVVANLGYKSIATEDATVFAQEKLEDFDVVIFLNTTGDILNAAQQKAFESFIQSGGGFVGIHAAADTEYEWSWYGKLVGAYFNGHPNDPNVREAIVIKKEVHPITEIIPGSWKRSDEWYNYKNMNTAVHVLLELDENSYAGGTMNHNHPITWYHSYDGGRAFYTGMGHTDETYDDPLFKEMIGRAIKYVANE